MFRCYLDFLVYCLEKKNVIPETTRDIDWNKMLVWAERQSIVGVIFWGIQQAGKALNIPYDVLMKWIGYINIIENRNKQLNERCHEVGKLFKGQGFDYCVLKGQGNALMYPNPMLRTPGDIDIWLYSKSDEKCKKFDVRKIVENVKERNPKGRAEYHHIDYGDFNGVEVEVHYRPSFSNNLIYNRRLQKWFYAQAERQYVHIVDIPDNAGSICVPTFEFNIIFQLSHIYRHLIQEGIGLRQIVDYYYLLKSDVRCKKEEVAKTLKYLGLEKMAGAVMWVLHEKLGLEEEYLIAPMDERRGKLLLDEIMRGGNFGHYDENNRKATTAIKKNILRIKRDLRMMRYFPSECLWEPVFRVYHFFWRLRYN